MAPKDRKRVMLRFAEKIREHATELALLETLDMGKPIGDSISIEAPATANCIQYYAEAIDKVYDEVAPTDAKGVAMILRETLGVVGTVVSWNFPMIMDAWKLGPVQIGSAHI